MAAAYGEGKRQMDMKECIVILITRGRNSKGVKR